MFTNIAGRLSEEREVQSAYSNLMKDIVVQEEQAINEAKVIDESKNVINEGIKEIKAFVVEDRKGQIKDLGNNKFAIDTGTDREIIIEVIGYK